MLKPTLALLTLAACLPAPLAAQEKAEPEPAYFRLTFVYKEVEGAKVINSREFVLQASTARGNRASVRTGTRVPFPTSSFDSGKGTVTATQFQWYDIGVNIDCSNLRESGGNLTFVVSADISSLAPPEGAAAPIQPAVRQNRWNSDVIIPLKKPTTIYQSDDLNSKRQLQLEVTAIPLK
jgi:hypothetical protein